MSQLRAPAPRSDRREGGRHGRTGARPASGGNTPQVQPPASHTTEARIRPQLLRTSVLPAVAVALGWAAAVLFTIRSTGAEPTSGLWIALTGAAALTVASVTAAALGADRAARAVRDRCEALRRSGVRGQSELRTIVEHLSKGEQLPARAALPPNGPGDDEFDLLARELARSHEAAVAAVVQAAKLAGPTGNEQKVEVFVHLARRLQSLVHREIQLLDELENEVEDPDLLKGLFHVDHLATRVRRHAENLAVLGGAVSRRQWSNPVSMTEVLRSSIAEVEQYPRVKLVPPIDGTLRGHAVADVIHLLAELVENATLFSAPHTTVLLRAQYVSAGLAIEVEDRGLGMPVSEQARMNTLLADPDQVSAAHLLQDGRIGLFVVSALARRHGITARLQSNIYGGVQAVLVLPQGLLGTDADCLSTPEHRTSAHPVPPVPVPGQSPAPTASAPPPKQTPQTPTPPPAPTPPSRPEPARTPRRSGYGEQPRTSTADTYGDPTSIPAPSGYAEPLRTPAPHGHPDPTRTPAADPTRSDDARTGPPASLLAPLPTAPADRGRPLLPRRRAQEHIAPQLRDEPLVRKPEDHALHDPGLMAAFQRGIGLAESQPTPHEPSLPGDARKE
ncbi:MULTISPECIES: sensor histidine kinase [unclassified Streptomyces]|uniref:sensor histidine kinase n=1 Tax=unclassified Streptomyces TaxID=2593676 RepID=UPI00380380AA